jgi:hypothetical protein
MSLHIFGIRHHGPGCARSLRAALDRLEPDVLVLEGPADAEDSLTWAAREEMRPPVALLLYPPSEPRRASYYPLAEFSPEWQALRWAAERKVPVRLMDLPQSCQLAIEAKEKEEDLLGPDAADAGDKETAIEDHGTNGPANGEAAPASGNGEPTTEPLTWRTDPLALLAEAAGYKDHELWWEEQIERRRDATDLFAAILEAMRTVRTELPEAAPRDLIREAHMRRTIRAVAKTGAERIAVVCGAWHGPVLDEAAIAGKLDGCRAKDDDERLRGLPKTKVTATWIPWTHSRLTFRSGYGAGVHSPGWYAHLWHSNHRAGTRWIASAARLLREKDLDASSACVIEAVRLADALAAMRQLRSPGLAELNEAVLTVLCHGDAAPLRLIRQRLEIGDALGSVPDDAPAVPLAEDVARLQKSLRLKASPEERLLDLDLRGDVDLARSHLFHRLRLLGIGWGTIERSGGKASTFHEVWRIAWQPEFAVAVIEASVWGNTVEGAAAAKVVHEADTAVDLPKLTGLLDSAILAGLAGTVDPLLRAIQSLAAVAADVRHLLEALLPLARVARYGDVRRTRADQLEPILVGMFERALVGLSAACSALDDEAAERMLSSVGQAQQALDHLDRADLQDEWQAQLLLLVSSNVHPLVRGWCCRLLVERRRIDAAALDRFARLALSTAVPPAEAAAWAAGLLRGSGLLLLHQEALWQVFDGWLAGLSEEMFVELLPLLRRAFADFTQPERRQMGDKVKHLGGPDGGRSAARAAASAEINVERANKVLPVLAHILGTT